MILYWEPGVAKRFCSMCLSENLTSSRNSSFNIRKHKTRKLCCGRGLTSWVSAAKKEKAEMQATGMNEKCTRPIELLIDNNHKEQGFMIEYRKLLRLCLDFIIFRSRVQSRFRYYQSRVAIWLENVSHDS